MRVSRTIFPAITIYCLLALAPAVSLSSPDSAVTECDFKEFYDIYGDAYFACEETRQAIAEYTDSCFKNTQTEDLRRMARICFMCDFIDDDNCERYIDEYKTPKNYFNEILYLEAIYEGDEKKALKQLQMKEKNANRNNSDTWRVIADGYEYYGDTDKAIQILIYYIQKDPLNYRIANDLSFSYLNIGDFENAEYYAEYYRGGDDEWPGPDIVEAEIAYYRNDLEQAWIYLRNAQATGAIEGQKPFLEGKYYVAEQDYENAYKAFERVKGSSPVIWIFGDNRWLPGVAELYTEIYDQNDGDLPGVPELEQIGESLGEQKKYIEAARYYYLCRMMEPGQIYYLYNTARMLELAGDMSQAVSYYSIYLALNPDAEEKDDIMKFLDSRKTKPFKPTKVCSDYFDSKKCNDADENCYWNKEDSKCYEKLKTCFEYRTSDSCNRAPIVAECYWNTSMQYCVSREMGCWYYKTRSACQAAQTDSGDCVWDEKGNACRRR